LKGRRRQDADFIPPCPPPPFSLFLRLFLMIGQALPDLPAPFRCGPLVKYFIKIN
jgi:hypothetical protein